MSTSRTPSTTDSAELPAEPRPSPSQDVTAAETAHGSLQRDLDGVILDVRPAWVQQVFFGLLVLTLVAIVFASVARVELTSHGPAVLRTIEAPARPIRMPLSGTIAEVIVHGGDAVAAGDPIFRIDSASVQRESLETDSVLAHARERLAYLEGQGQTSLVERTALLERQVALIEQRIAAQGQAKLDKLSLEERAVEIRAQISALRADHDQSVWRAKQDVVEAEAKARGLRLALDEAVVRAPQAGVVDALVPRVGDVLQTGSVVARLVPGSAPMKVIALLPERDRALLDDGASVRVELDQLAWANATPIHARVARVSRELATPAEIQELLGSAPHDDGPAYRAELELVDDEALAKRVTMMRPGMLGHAYFLLRSRSLLAVALSPLRLWLER